MRVLGIETSCDETAAAVVDDGVKIISNVVSSSAYIHAKTGGVIPEIAARQQIKSIIPVINEALKDIPLSSIDAIAVTVGPGLIGSLLVGVETAKTISHLWQKPIIPVNHLVAHLYANFLLANPKSSTEDDITFPALGLVVSGGHTDLVLMTDHGKMEYIGGTRDDAAGEAFDKTARLLNLPYPGGPNLSIEAEKYLSKLNDRKNSGLTFFPRPLIDDDNFEWSFSGLKTAVMREVAKRTIDSSSIPEIAAEVQEAIVDSLVVKSVRAIQKFDIQDFLLAGGVAANSRLREKFEYELVSKNSKAHLHVPEPKFCTDNASYIAACAYFLNKPIGWENIVANPNLTITE